MSERDAPIRELEQGGPDTKLADASLILAIVMEMPCGIEGGLIYGRLWDSGVFSILAAKVTCLTVIFLPLVIYTRRYGLRAVKYVRGRAITVGVIAAICLAHNFVMLWLEYSANG